MGLAVNSADLLRRSSIIVMDDDELPHTWKQVQTRVAMSPKGTIAQLARMLRMDSSQLSRQLKGGEGELTVTQAQRILAYFKGEGPPDDVPAARQAQIASASSRHLPTYGYPSTEPDRFLMKDGTELDPTPLPPGFEFDPKTHFVVAAPSSTMEPRVFVGETLIARRNYPPGRDRKAVVEFTDGTAMLVNFRALRSGRVYAEVFNPPSTLDFDATKVRAIHAVIAAL